MGTAAPKIADVQCSRLQFEPGDRILVKVYHSLSKEESNKLQRTVERWAGNCVEVLIIDVTKMELVIERAKNRLQIGH